MDEIDLDLTEVMEEAIRYVSKEICQHFKVFPYKINDKIIFLTSYEEKEEGILEDIEFVLKREVSLSICSKEQFFKYISIYYEENYRHKIAEGIKKQGYSPILKEQVEVDSPVVKIVDSIIKEGIYKEASDIHIEPGERNVQVRYRIDGTLKTFSNLPMRIFPSIISRIKIMGNMDISQRFVPQDGEINFKCDKSCYDFRVSTLPTIHGEKCVFRLLKRGNQYHNLKNIGFREEDYITLKNITKFKQGMILITGATGSGKTSTLYAILKEIDAQSKNIITIEKPVECQIPGINQVSIGTVGNNTYQDIVKTVLRQDPDVIMIGEILDKATAEVAINASLTGHLVLSTLHTNDASSTISRLRNMGITPDLIRDSLIMIIAQRLTRCICDDCKKTTELTEGEKELLLGSGITLSHKGVGCGRCSYTGYHGRRIVYEMLTMTDKVKKVIDTGDSDRIREVAVSEGMITMDEYYKELIREGITTVEEYYSNMEIHNIKNVIGRDYGI